MLKTKFKIMENYGYLLTLLLLANCGVNSKSPLCPDYCKCYIISGVRHASCIGQRLPNIDTGVPSNVQILDLSNNTISSLERKGFKNLGLTSLYKLELQHNHIGTIDLHAFLGVAQLQILNLSYNHLYFILPATFEDTPHLRHLYLAGNRLKFHDGPVLLIPTLQILDLSNCQIDHLLPESLGSLPALESLNLSHNQLIQLDTRVLEPLGNLNRISVNRNPWSCDGNAYKLLATLSELDIQHDAICENRKQDSTEEFQNMITVVNNTHYDNDVEIMSDDDLVRIWYQNEDKMAKMKNLDQWMCENNDNSSSKTRNGLGVIDKIPSFWCLLIGFEIGCVVGGLFMWLLLRLQNTRPRSFPPIMALPNRTSLLRLRSTLEESTGLCEETYVPDCPGTPPPPYRDVFATFPRITEIPASRITNSQEN